VERSGTVAVDYYRVMQSTEQQLTLPVAMLSQPVSTNETLDLLDQLLGTVLDTNNKALHRLYTRVCLDWSDRKSWIIRNSIKCGLNPRFISNFHPWDGSNNPIQNNIVKRPRRYQAP
jgi:hypothetical protein